MSDRERLSVTMAREHVADGHGGKYAHYCYRCECFEAQRDAASWQLLAIEKRRVWRYPSWPDVRRVVGLGSDEYQRRTVWVGPLVLALWRCRCEDCRADLARLRADADADYGQEDRDGQPGRYAEAQR